MAVQHRTAAADRSGPAGRPVLASHFCGNEPATAAAWQCLFDGITGAWPGGDGASSTRLPDGRLLWLFGDTFVGGVTATGEREASTRVVRNSIVVTEGSCVSVLPTVRDALPGGDRTWLWPTHSVLTSSGAAGSASQLGVFAQRVRRSGPGAFDFERVATSVVRVTVPWLGTPIVRAVSDLARSTVLWGAGLAADGPVTFTADGRPRTPRCWGGTRCSPAPPPCPWARSRLGSTGRSPGAPGLRRGLPSCARRDRVSRPFSPWPWSGADS